VDPAAAGRSRAGEGCLQLTKASTQIRETAKEQKSLNANPQSRKGISVMISSRISGLASKLFLFRGLAAWR
jgi:hypothetical protein